MQWILVVLVGAVVGFLGGLFGKGGSAVATPVLAAIGLPAIVAVASPLPATIPGTLVAYRRYRRSGVSDPEVVRWSIVFGVPATVIGAVATRWIGGDILVRYTDIAVALVGLLVLLRPDDPTRQEVLNIEVSNIEMSNIEMSNIDVSGRRLRLAVASLAVGFLAGLLANAGGFLLVPVYLAALKLPVKTALACSLAVASVLALPGTIVHAALGHIDWTVTALFGAASIPLSSLGARTALRMRPAHLERVYGAGLLTLGVGLFVLA